MAIVLAVLVVVAGVVVAVRGWLATSGPDGAVRGYFEALSRGDAETALGYGAIPEGDRTPLRADVLRDQLQVAGIDDIRVRRVADDGDRARVSVDYTLGFAAGPRRMSSVVEVRRIDGDWRLARVAVPTQLLLANAVQRATLAGGALPAGTALFFPGAAPVRFDTPYLRLAAARGAIALDGGTTTQVDVEVSPQGRTAALAATRAALTSCLASSSDPRCPLPTERYVPGSVRGTLAGSLADQLEVRVASGDAGELEVRGDASVRGRYQRLEFDNRVTSRSGTFRLPVLAYTYAVAPLALRWEQSS